MAGSDGARPPERPGSMLRPRQSAIRLRRQSAMPRTSSRPPAPTVGGSVGGETPDRAPSGPSRSASISVPGTFRDDGGAGARTRRSNRLREPSALTPALPEEPQESEEGGGDESPMAKADDDKAGKPGILSRLRWNSDTNLHAASPSSDAISEKPNQQTTDQHEYDDEIVNLLDAIDPEVNTLSSITNVQNSLYAPPLGRFINRRPAYNLTRLPRPPGAFPPDIEEESKSATRLSAPSEETEESRSSSQEEQAGPGRPSIERIPSNMTDSFFAVRPHGISFADWSDEDLDELNDHVRHMLHSRQSAMHRRLKAFGQYVRRPLGFLITLYATLITLFGLAWVLFLIGWIYVGEEQLYVINVIDNVLVALFAIVGDGMIPWRLVDTYHMAHIARYSLLTWKLRGKMAVPKLRDKNDLPTETIQPNEPEQAGIDLESALNNAEKEVSVLTPKQQSRLEHHQQKFAKSHTFYKPHETETHYAFPLRFLITIVCLLDLHSCLQLALGLTTWCIDYRVRPMAATATILSCSIVVNITAGVFIMVGDRRTRKKDVVERIFRQDLTKEAMRRVRKRRKEKAKKEERKSRRSMASDRRALDPDERHSFSPFRKSADKDRARSEGRRSCSRLGRLGGQTSRHGSPNRTAMPREAYEDLGNNGRRRSD